LISGFYHRGNHLLRLTQRQWQRPNLRFLPWLRPQFRLLYRWRHRLRYVALYPIGNRKNLDFR
jgi:hypothetical protein